MEQINETYARDGVEGIVRLFERTAVHAAALPGAVRELVEAAKEHLDASLWVDIDEHSATSSKEYADDFRATRKRLVSALAAYEKESTDE